MIINHEYKFGYIGIPRTGSTSIVKSLDMLPGGEKLGHHRMDIPAGCEDYYIFTTVRNPYVRLLSHYRHRHRHYPDNVGKWNFEEYLDKVVTGTITGYGLNNDKPQASYPRDYYETHFFKLEEIQDTWRTLPFWRNCPVPLLHVNQSFASEGGGYTEAIADRVYQHFKIDFERFDYRRDSWVPLLEAGVL